MHVFPGPGVYEVTLTALSTFALRDLATHPGGSQCKREVGRSPILSFFPNPVSEMLTVELKVFRRWTFVFGTPREFSSTESRFWRDKHRSALRPGLRVCTGWNGRWRGEAVSTGF
ncbi:MAG: hypothetical protein IPG32_21565 [Saprospirales bacterium]|nr:hypothetical protein [Saprospirales bacterium]